MSVSLSQCFVAVHDPDLALGFYRDALGLELRSDILSEGFRWVTLSPPAQPDVEIVLVEPHSGRGQDDGDALATLLKRGSLRGVVFRTGDVEETFDEARAHGAGVVQAPQSQLWGVAACCFRGPTGT